MDTFLPPGLFRGRFEGFLADTVLGEQLVELSWRDAGHFGGLVDPPLL